MSKKEKHIKKKISKKLFLLGLVIFVISYLLPVYTFENYTNLRLTGLTSIFVFPIIVLIGLIFWINEKDRFFIVLNILLILLQPIAMFVGNISNAIRTRKQQSKQLFYGLFFLCLRMI